MKDWNAVFPELEWIEDDEIRNKVVKVWERAGAMGGWDTDDIEEIPFTLLVKDTDIDLVKHTRIVTSISRRVGKSMAENGYDINNDHLIAGALLHDVGKLLEYRSGNDGISVSRSGRMLRHPLSGMGLAMVEGLPEEICHIIAVHSREGERSYRSPEAIIVHHADFISFETVKALDAG